MNLLHHARIRLLLKHAEKRKYKMKTNTCYFWTAEIVHEHGNMIKITYEGIITL